MNDHNLEQQLRSWTLREPHEKISLELFGPDSVESDVSLFTLWKRILSFSMPAVALVTLVFVQMSEPPRVRDFAMPVVLATISSNSHDAALNSFACNASMFNMARNRWNTTTFESTNLSQSPSSMGSLPVLRTNN